MRAHAVLTRVAAVGLSFGVLGSVPQSVDGQRPNTRVVVNPTRVEMATPGTRAPIKTGSNTHIESWLDSDVAPASVRVRAGGQLIVVAGTVTVDATHYSMRGVSRFMIVADEIRVRGEVVFDLSAADAGRGGSMRLIARRLICEPGARLTILSTGGDVPRISSSGGGPGGDLLVATEAGDEPACLRHVARGGHSRAGTVLVNDHRTGARVRQRRETWPRRAGRPGTLTIGGLFESVRDTPGLHRTTSIWAVQLLEHLHVRAYDAARRRDRAELMSTLRRYEVFTFPNGPTDDLRDRYLEVVTDLNGYRDQVVEPIHVQTIEVSLGAGQRPVTVITEGSSLVNSVAPTEALVATTRVGDRTVLGVLEFRPDEPDLISVEFELSLSMDPWTRSVADQHFVDAGERSGGLFTGWRLTPRPLDELGVRSSSISPVGGGERLRVRLELEGSRAALLFWKLYSTTGIPLEFDWEFRDEATGRFVTGEWVGPPLSLARRLPSAVSVVGGNLVNESPATVRVEYLRTGSDSFESLGRAVTLGPGERIGVATLTDIPASDVSVPPEAVETVSNPLRIQDDFHVLNGDEFIDEVTIANLLPRYDEERGGRLEFVEVFLSTATGLDGALEKIAGPYRIAPEAEASLQLLRLSPDARVLYVTGTVRWEGGSYRTLEPIPFETLAILLTPELLLGGQP